MDKLFSVFAYLLGLIVTVYYIDFFTGFYVDKWINSETDIDQFSAFGIDFLLLLLFGIQHSLMARKDFKSWLNKNLNPRLNRSTYIFFSSISLGALIYFWQPVNTVVYEVNNEFWSQLIIVFYYLGWLIGIISTFQIDHLELFGLKQVFIRGKQNQITLKKPFLYRVVRHPIYLGWMLVHWCTPVMTSGHFLLAIGITFYIHVAIYFEERDLESDFGQDYLNYKSEVPAINPMLHLFKRKPR